MFGFLKEKLKSWIGESKKKIESSLKESSSKEKKAKEKKPKKEAAAKKEKPVKKEKKKKSSEEIKKEREITAELIKDIAKENLEVKTPEEKVEESIAKSEITEESAKKLGFFEKLKNVFTYTLTEDNFESIFSELEVLLLEGNVALEVVEEIKKELHEKLVGKQIKKEKINEEIKNSLKESLEKILIDPENIIEKIKEHKKTNEPYVVLFFGINGAGKTTSIAKFAHLLQKNKLSCILAAADTFRAASIEQISIHADRLGVKVIKHDYGSDPSSVAFDAIKYAKANKIDAVLIDTAGRMHTKENLLKEMEKICRVAKPNLKVFVAEAVAGNDATEQAKAFNEMIGVDSSILSKTDVDEKGGAIISVAFITKKPILYLGVGQNYEDLELFNKKKFIERLGL